MRSSLKNGSLGCTLLLLLAACGGGGVGSAQLTFSPDAPAPPSGATGVAYPAFKFVVPTGGAGPFSWTETGALPRGMSLSSAGQLSGTPQTLGSFPFTLTVTDSSNPHQVATESVTLVIKDSPPLVGPASPPAGIVNYPYLAYPSFGFSASRGSPPYSWKVSSGSPPPGLTVGTDGSVSGTPTTTGTFSFSVTATDSAHPPMASAPRATQITVGPGPCCFTVLHSFAGSPTDGMNPFGTLLFLQGVFYGTTFSGGSSNAGVVFKLTPDGKETVLHNFGGSPTDGVNPVAGLISDDSGNLYGTTRLGGASGNGVVFKLDPTGKESVLYSFTGGADGGDLQAGLVRDSTGNLYGATNSGGAGWGVVFKLDPTGKETVLYTFTGAVDGNPYATLLRDAAGNLYGSTFGGIVFKLDPTGARTVLHDFTVFADGGGPFVAGLIQDPAGNLYGTTPYGGDRSALQGLGCGVVFELDPTGNETVLYTFTGGADGCQPRAALLRDTEGNLYGTTSTSGVCPECGVVFKVDMTGKETVLHSFTGPDGLQADVGLIRDANGALYGATVGGGALYNAKTPGDGVVFRLIP